MCNCRSDIEGRLLERMRGQLPADIQELSVSLEGYALFMGGADGVGMKNVMPIRIDYKVPVKPKKGAPTPSVTALKDKKQTMNMVGSYCMFCGVKYEEDANNSEV